LRLAKHRIQANSAIRHGQDLPDSPVTLNPQFQAGPEPITEFVIPVGKWSDGTAAPVM
jgi:hypothetical protein